MRRALQRIGRENHHEVDGETLPAHLAQVSDASGDIAAEYVDRHGVADPDAERLSDLTLERDERLAGIALRPPRAGNHGRALRHLVRIAEAAIAIEHPLRLGLRAHLLRRTIADSHDTSAQHRRMADQRAWRLLLDQLAESLDVVAGQIEDEEVRCVLRHAAAEFIDDRGIDQRHRDQQRQPRTERHHDGAGETARRAKTAECQSERRSPRARDHPRQTREPAPEPRENHQDARCTGAEVERDPLGI